MYATREECVNLINGAVTWGLAFLEMLVTNQRAAWHLLSKNALIHLTDQQLFSQSCDVYRFIACSISIRKYFLIHRKSLGNVTDGKGNNHRGKPEQTSITWATFNSVLAWALISSQDITVLHKDHFTQYFAQYWGIGWANTWVLQSDQQMKELGICAFVCRVCGVCHGSFILQVQVCTWISGTLRATFHSAGMSSMHPFYKQNIVHHYPLAGTWALCRWCRLLCMEKHHKDGNFQTNMHTIWGSLRKGDHFIIHYINTTLTLKDLEYFWGTWHACTFLCSSVVAVYYIFYNI